MSSTWYNRRAEDDGAAGGPQPARRVVIVTHNSAADLGACLSALVGECVVVVDNASSDGTLNIAISHQSRPLVIANSHNVGFAVAANQGIRVATRSDVALVNPDVVVTQATLDRLAATAQCSGAGLVAPRLVYPNGAPQESVRTFPTAHRLLARCTPVGRTAMGRQWRSEYLTPAWSPGTQGIDWVIGAVMYLPRASLDVAGGFDESFFLYGEDVDLCARLWRAGLPVVCDSAATATHRYTRASRRLLDLRQPSARHHWASMARLAWKYPRQFFLGSPVVPRTSRGVTS